MNSRYIQGRQNSILRKQVALGTDPYYHRAIVDPHGRHYLQERTNQILNDKIALGMTGGGRRRAGVLINTGRGRAMMFQHPHHMRRAPAPRRHLRTAKVIQVRKGPRVVKSQLIANYTRRAPRRRTRASGYGDDLYDMGGIMAGSRRFHVVSNKLKFDYSRSFSYLNNFCCT